jgi:SSS family transporter
MVQLDFIVLVIFAFLIFGIGLAFTRIGSKSSQAFFEAGGATPWWINGLSLFISYFSAGTFVVWGSIAYKHGIVANTIQLTMAISGLLVAVFIAKKWKKTGVKTAAEYIGKRFNLKTQQFYTYMVLLLSLFTTASVLYPVGKMVQVATPYSLNTCIMIIGLIIVLYTAAGGLWAVLVTDVVQFVILTASVLIVIPIAFDQIGGPAKLISNAPVGFYEPFNTEYTFPFMLAFIVYQTVYIGGNWSYVQRYTSVKDEKSSRKVAYLFTILYLVSPFIWMIPPMIYRIMNPDLAGLGAEGAYMMLCQKILPAGLIGLVLAGMISATSSKANTTINLAATVFATDLYKNLIRKSASEKEQILVARIFTLLFGAGTVFIALLVPRIGGIVDFVLSIASIAGGALFAPIIWSLFSKRQTAVSVVTVTIITLSINLFFKVLAPTLLDIKLSRTWETVIGQSIPLISLFFFEIYYKIKGQFAENPVVLPEMSVVTADAADEDDSNAQNNFGIKVIAISMAIVGAGIATLGFISAASSTIVASVGAIIMVISFFIWRATLPSKLLSVLFLLGLSFSAGAQTGAIKKVLVNQAGYNLNESKRLVAWGIKDGEAFQLRSVKSGNIVFKGNIKQYSGDFSPFNPSGNDEYTAEVNGLIPSVPFRIKAFYQELVSTKMAYDFFVDVRGSTDPVNSNEAKVYGGGPSRDVGAYGLETVFETMFFASNPALFDNWKNELGDGKVPDLIKLILWHAEFAYHHHAYNGPVGNRHGWLGYEGTPKMNYDYWNTLDQLAAVCAAYHTFLKPYLSEEKYQAYRKVCLEKWTAYDRHKVVRYWTHSNKWVDPGYQEFNEMGNAFGQSVFSNLFMYLSEKNEKDGQPEKFLNWATESVNDIVKNWDFNNIRHMWWIRNAEHITPQALAFYLMMVPDKAPAGAKQKLNAWMDHIIAKSNNPWHYRVHSDTEWAHPKTKELGGAPALGGSLFAAAHILNRPEARPYAWSQVNFTFGLNPLGAHFSNKSKERIAINGYWEDVEIGWPQAHPHGYGMLGLVRGTLDGTPLDKDFPRYSVTEVNTISDGVTDKIGLNAYATEGWATSNRGWLATLTFSTLHSTELKIVNQVGQRTAKSSSSKAIFVELRAPLNINPSKKDVAWVEQKMDGGKTARILLTETDIDSGVFRAALEPTKGKKLLLSYGYWAFRKEASLQWN